MVTNITFWIIMVKIYSVYNLLSRDICICNFKFTFIEDLITFQLLHIYSRINNSSASRNAFMNYTSTNVKTIIL